MALLGGLCFGAFHVMQLRYQTTWTIDKHLAYGIWFAAIAAGYACSKFITVASRIQETARSTVLRGGTCLPGGD